MPTSTLDHFDEDGDLIREIEGLEHLSSAPKKVMLFFEDGRKGFLDIIDSWLPEKYKNTKYESVGNFENFEVVSIIIVNDETDDQKFSCPKCGEILDEEDILEHGVTSKIYLIFPKDRNRNYFYLVTNKASNELKTDLGFFNAYYPLISRVAFRSRHIRASLENLESKKDLKVRNYVAKRYYGDKTTTERHEPDGISVEDAFSRAQRNDTWIDSLACEVDGTRIRVSRNGLVQYYQGYRYGEIYSDLLKPLFEEAEERFKEISNRNIQKGDTFIYETENAVFDQKSAGEELINIISSGNNYDVAKMSPDIIKPELLVKDYDSASSFAVNVISNREILIHPESEVTNIALNNLINKIADKYEGGIIDGHS